MNFINKVKKCEISKFNYYIMFHVTGIYNDQYNLIIKHFMYV